MGDGIRSFLTSRLTGGKSQDLTLLPRLTGRKSQDLTLLPGFRFGAGELLRRIASTRTRLVAIAYGYTKWYDPSVDHGAGTENCNASVKGASY